jgi:hypothetical protein
MVRKRHHRRDRIQPKHCHSSIIVRKPPCVSSVFLFSPIRLPCPFAMNMIMIMTMIIIITMSKLYGNTSRPFPFTPPYCQCPAANTLSILPAKTLPRAAQHPSPQLVTPSSRTAQGPTYIVAHPIRRLMTTVYS